MEQDNVAVPTQDIAETSRKQFLKTSGTVAAGAVALAAAGPALAEAASVAKPSVGRELAPVTVTIYRGAVTTSHDWFGDLITKFEAKNPTIKVKSLFAPQSSTSAHDQYVAQLSGGSSAVDIYQVDVIWPPEFAAAGWILPVDKYLSASFKADLLPGPVLGTTINGKMYAIPLFTDSGMLYYRTDLLSKYKLAPPQTWMDMVHAAQTVMQHEKSVPYGMLWQGAQYEGLFCDIAELFWANGGNVLQNFSGKKVVLNTPNNVAALQFMIDTIWKYKMAPVATTTYMEEDTRRLFQNGKSVFMRNWPYVWSQANDSKQSKIAGKLQLKPLPHGPHGKPAACLGGWNLAINAKSKNPDAAAKVALFVTSFESQKYQSIKASLNPTLSSVYHDPDVLKVNPWYKNFYEVVRGALPRPVSKDETKISDRVTRQVNAALKKQISAAAALANAQKDVEGIVGNSGQP